MLLRSNARRIKRPSNLSDVLITVDKNNNESFLSPPPKAKVKKNTIPPAPVKKKNFKEKDVETVEEEEEKPTSPTRYAPTSPSYHPISPRYVPTSPCCHRDSDGMHDTRCDYWKMDSSQFGHGTICDSLPYSKDIVPFFNEFWRSRLNVGDFVCVSCDIYRDKWSLRQIMPDDGQTNSDQYWVINGSFMLRLRGHALEDEKIHINSYRIRKSEDFSQEEHGVLKLCILPDYRFNEVREDGKWVDGYWRNKLRCGDLVGLLTPSGEWTIITVDSVACSSITCKKFFDELNKVAEFTLHMDSISIQRLDRIKPRNRHDPVRPYDDWRNKLDVGKFVAAFDEEVAGWFKGIVICVSPRLNVLIHFTGVMHKYDRWYCRESENLALLTDFDISKMTGSCRINGRYEMKYDLMKKTVVAKPTEYKDVGGQKRLFTAQELYDLKEDNTDSKLIVTRTEPNAQVILVHSDSDDIEMSPNNNNNNSNNTQNVVEDPIVSPSPPPEQLKIKVFNYGDPEANQLIELRKKTGQSYTSFKIGDYIIKADIPGFCGKVYNIEYVHIISVDTLVKLTVIPIRSERPIGALYYTVKLNHTHRVWNATYYDTEVRCSREQLAYLLSISDGDICSVKFRKEISYAYLKDQLFSFRHSLANSGHKGIGDAAQQILTSRERESEIVGRVLSDGNKRITGFTRMDKLNAEDGDPQSNTMHWRTVNNREILSIIHRGIKYVLV